MSHRTPLARVAGLGSARDGVGHWWAQRVTSIALIPLTPLAIFTFGPLIGAERAAVLATLADPFHAVVTILFVAVTFRHLQQGLQVVIEDYVHHTGWRTALLVGNGFLCWTAGLAGIFGVARIAFGA